MLPQLAIILNWNRTPVEPNMFPGINATLLADPTPNILQLLYTAIPFVNVFDHSGEHQHNPRRPGSDVDLNISTQIPFVPPRPPAPLYLPPTDDPLHFRHVTIRRVAGSVEYPADLIVSIAAKMAQQPGGGIKLQLDGYERSWFRGGGRKATKMVSVSYSRAQEV
jgi:hypothetical protein